MTDPIKTHFDLTPGEPLHRHDEIWWNGKWQEILAGWETGATVTKGMHYRRKMETGQKVYEPNFRIGKTKVCGHGLLICPVCGMQDQSKEKTLAERTYHPKTAAAVFDVSHDSAFEESPVVHAMVCNAIEGELIAAHREALTLATSIWRAEYQGKAPNWGPCDSVAGIISQIDNMYAGMRQQRDTAQANNRKAICVYCGFQGERTPEAMLEHVQGCEKHPIGRMLKILAEIDQELYAGMLPLSYEPDRALTIRTHNKLYADKANQYDELIMAVSMVTPGETRHQTALRYIRQAEKGDDTAHQEGKAS